VKFQKNLQFHYEFWYKAAILGIDAVFAVVLVLLTHHPIGIVLGLLAGVIVEVVLSHLLIKPTPLLQLNKAYLQKIIDRGKHVTAGGIFNYLFQNADKMIVGRMLGTASLGSYQIGYALAILPLTEIGESLSRVTFPIFTKIAKDRNRLKKAFLKIVLAVIILTLPFGLLLFFFPREIVLFVLGEQWLSVVPILPLLAVFSVIRVVTGYSNTLFLAVGKQKYVSVGAFIGFVALVVPVVPLIQQFGLYGAAIAVLISTFVSTPIYLFYTWKVLFKK
jgi:O-antigen/teichoic acid export membrane protein